MSREVKLILILIALALVAILYTMSSNDIGDRQQALNTYQEAIK